MSFNPFKEKTKNLEVFFEPWQDLVLKPFNNSVSPYTKIRLNLALSIEESAIKLCKAYSANVVDTELARALALIRRLDCHTRIKQLSLFPAQYSEPEKILISELTEIALSAICAQNELNKQIKSSLNFILIEDFDHLYRLVNLFAAEKSTQPIIDELGDWLGWKSSRNHHDIKIEVMPGRPTISQHRHAFDDVRRYIDSDNTLTHTKVNQIITSAVQNYAAFCYTPASCGTLFAELASIEEQHATHIDSLSDANAPYVNRLLLHKFAECYVYHSLSEEENEKMIKSLYESCLNKKIAQINYVRELLNKQNRDYEDVLGDAKLAPVFNLEESHERNNLYIRHVLKNIADNTQVAGEFLKANDLTKNYTFFKYNDSLNAPISKTASHAVVNRHIAEFGEDFRVEQSPHPIAALRTRDNDNTDYARK